MNRRGNGSYAQDADGGRNGVLEGNGYHRQPARHRSRARTGQAGDEILRSSIGRLLAMDPGDLAGLTGRPLSSIASALASGHEAVEAVATLRDDIRVLRESARTDWLTGILNRRGIEERLQTEWARWQRHRTPLAVLIADVDGLKHVNDTHGHVSGDLLIRAVARHLAALIRTEDAVGRIGGDEFIIVCADADEESTQAIMRKLDDTLAAQHIDVLGRLVPVRVSIGGASTSTNPAASPAQLVGAADARLYEEKQRRRRQDMVAAQVPLLPTGRTPHRMLIVDDDPDIRFLLRL